MPTTNLTREATAQALHGASLAAWLSLAKALVDSGTIKEEAVLANLKQFEQQMAEVHPEQLAHALLKLSGDYGSLLSATLHGEVKPDDLSHTVG